MRDGVIRHSRVQVETPYLRRMLCWLMRFVGLLLGRLNMNKQKQSLHINLHIMRVAASEQADPLLWQNLHDYLRLWVCTLIRASAEPARSREKEQGSRIRTRLTRKILVLLVFSIKNISVNDEDTDKKKSAFWGGLKRTSKIWVLIPFSPKYSTVTKASSSSDSLSIVHPTSRLTHISRYPDAFSVENLWNKSMQIEMKATHMWTYWSHVQARSQQSFKVLLNWWAM